MATPELPTAVKLMIQSGVIPPSTVRQLINWRLLPEDSEGLIGNLPVNLDGAWETVEKFVGDLKGALVDEMRTIRETELDHPGGFRDAKLYFGGKIGKGVSGKVLIDRLDRVITPADNKWEKLTAVRFVGGNVRAVLKNEFRYEGEQKVAIVHYLEKEEMYHDN